MEIKLIYLTSIFGLLTCNIFSASPELIKQANSIDAWLKVAKAEFMEPVDVALKYTQEAIAEVGKGEGNYNEAKVLATIEKIRNQIYKHRDEKDAYLAQLDD